MILVEAHRTGTEHGVTQYQAYVGPTMEVYDTDSGPFTVTTPGYFDYSEVPYILERYDQTVFFLRKLRPGEQPPANPQLQRETSSRPSAKDVAFLAQLTKKAASTLSREERSEMDFLSRKSPRYLTLKEKAINSLTVEERETYRKLSAKIDIGF